MGEIYITSDWHFCHVQPFLFKPRGFLTTEEMNAAIIKNHNKIVTDEDDVYCLGDCIMNDNEEGIKCIKQLKGKIHIIRGNHDTLAKIKLYESCPNVVEICDAKFLKVGKQNFFLSHYPCLSSSFDEQKSLDRRIISLAGHYHTKDRWIDFDKGLIYHVEMDTHNCKPVNIKDVITEIKEHLKGK